MKHATLRRHFAALLLGAALTTPAAWPAEARAESGQPAPATPKNLSLVLWGQLAALWERAGSFIDPFGRQTTDPESTETEPGDLGEAGSFIDPFG